jgi:putative SOS response-associated peptidase YedK
MCGRFTLQYSNEMLAQIFGAKVSQEIKPRYNISPTQKVPVVRTSPDDSTIHIDLLKWGLIPSWAKDPSIGSHMINARSETADQKPSFKNSLKHRRCIVPASGFYEWLAVEGKKHPLYIKLKDNSLMMLAGIWDHWKSPDGNVIESFSILTTSSNELISPLHDRMPVVLDLKFKDIWLDPKLTNPEQLKPYFKPYPSGSMEMYPVSDLVNSPKNETPECIHSVRSL